ncbi:MAG: hypothetical protein QM759_06580 [Terricaulis sp.]
MKTALASALAACAIFAAGLVATGVAGAGAQPTPMPVATIGASHALASAIHGVPADALPTEGACKLWYDGVPVDDQPAQMDCEHAQWLAKTWGGRVISHDAELAAYNGRNDFTGVPADALPARGYCRAWLDGVAAAQQPTQSDCVVARRIVEHAKGRVLFMPI